jgi:hypothetical protein
MLWVNHTQAAVPTLQELADITVQLSTNYDWSHEGAANGDRFGTAVHTAGDVNNDGFADILIGAPQYTHLVYREGAAFVFHGGGYGLGTAPDWIAGSGLQGASFGSAVSTAGDVNGDGYDDVIIGAEEYQVSFEGVSGTPPSGAVFVYHGSPDGLGTTWTWKVLAEADRIRFGAAVSTAGDVDADGYDDVIVSAPHFERDDGPENEGRVYLYRGGPTGLSITPAWTYECNQYVGLCGASLDAAGDVNGDGFADIVIGAPNCAATTEGAGCALVFLGSETGLQPTPDWVVDGPHSGALFGKAVAGAGDVNGDGYDDILVGAPGTTLDALEPEVGAAFLFFGSADGPGLTPDWTTYGLESYDQYGFALHRAGDVNQDEYGDVLVGAFYMGDSNDLERKPDEGAAYLFIGGPAGLGTQPAWSAYGGKADARFGYSLGTAGDVDGDSADDILVGAPYYKFDESTVVGKAFAFYSQGPDFRFATYMPVVFKPSGE